MSELKGSVQMNKGDRPTNLPEASMLDLAEKAVGAVCLFIGFIILITATSDTTAVAGVVAIVAGFTLLHWAWRK